MSNQVPLFMTSAPAAESVVLEAEFPSNALFFMQVPSEDSLYLFAQFWLGEKFSQTTQICSAVPKLTNQIHKELEKAGSQEFTLEGEMPLLKNYTSRLLTINVLSKEHKFVTKVTK